MMLQKKDNRVIAVSYHGSVNDLQALGLGDALAHSPFARLAWFKLVADHGKWAPLFAVAQDGQDYAILPLKREGGHLSALTNWYSFTWQPVVSVGSRQNELFEAIARDLKNSAHSISLSPLPDCTSLELRNNFKSSGWHPFLEPCDSNHILPVQGRTYAEYLTARPDQLRSTIKRKAKQVKIDIVDVFQDHTWDVYQTIYASSWKPEEGAPDLLRRFAAQEGVAGRLRLGIARHGDRPVAAQFWTVENGVAYIHKLAHLQEAKPLSAGTVLTAALMQHVIDIDRVELVDFGTGDDPYKRDWMEAVRTRWRLTCYDARNPRTWPSLGKALLRSLASKKRDG